MWGFSRFKGASHLPTKIETGFGSSLYKEELWDPLILSLLEVAARRDRPQAEPPLPLFLGACWLRPKPFRRLPSKGRDRAIVNGRRRRGEHPWTRNLRC